jgi:hypothetical protein
MDAIGELSRVVFSCRYRHHGRFRLDWVMELRRRGDLPISTIRGPMTLPKTLGEDWITFPPFPRHHPFYFALQQISHVGLGHHSAFRIERDFYGYHNTNTITKQPWQRESNFATHDNTDVIVMAEAFPQ